MENLAFKVLPIDVSVLDLLVGFRNSRKLVKRTSSF